MYTVNMKYFIVKINRTTSDCDSMIVAEADNLIDARDMRAELMENESMVSSSIYGILPSIAHSTMQQKEDTENAV